MFKRLEKYIDICGILLLPLVVFAGYLLYYLMYGSLGYGHAIVYHIAFWGGNLLLLLLLLYFNQGRLLFFSVSILLAYLAINYLKHCYGDEVVNSAYYHNILAVLPLNLWIFFLFYPKRFISTGSLVSLLFILGEYILLDVLSPKNIAFIYTIYQINIVVVIGFVILLSCSFINMIRSGRLYDDVVFFASSSVALGIYFSQEVSGFSLFFCLSCYMVLAFVVWQIYYTHLFDENTGIRNRYSYLKQSQKFPPKYSLGVISIDGYDGLSRGLNSKQKQELIYLIIDIIKENIDEFSIIYRYEENCFIIICEKNNIKEIYEIFETIRRSVAMSEFVLNRHPQYIKITISGGVAEKRRTDADASVVLMRAYNEMQKTLKFTGNVISPQPRTRK